MGKILINGFVEDRFKKVEETFYQNFKKKNELGACCSVFIDNKEVVKLWGGYKDQKKTMPWEENTKTLVFSATKGMSSLAFATLHSKGLLDFDEKVVHYWKEFGANGKEDITVRQLLAHEAGLMAIDKLISIEVLKDKERLAKKLANQKPSKKARGKKAYHTWTISLFQSELARRIDPLGRSIGTLFHDEIASKLDAKFHIGLPSDILNEQIADMVLFNPIDTLLKRSNEIPLKLVANFLNPFGIATRSFINPPFALAPYLLNSRRLKNLEIGSANGIGTASALAKVYGEFASGGKNLNIRKETIKELENFPDNPNNNNVDIVLQENIIYSLGVEKPSPFFNFGSNSRAYGHQGAGGSAAFADPENKLGFAYAMNQMGTNIANDPREKALRDAVYKCL